MQAKQIPATLVILRERSDRRISKGAEVVENDRMFEILHFVQDDRPRKTSLTFLLCLPKSNSTSCRNRRCCCLREREVLGDLSCMVETSKEDDTRLSVPFVLGRTGIPTEETPFAAESVLTFREKDVLRNIFLTAPSSALREGGVLKGNLGRFPLKSRRRQPIEHFSRNARD